MTRENKVALVIGFALVLFAGILVSDHLSNASSEQLADLLPPEPIAAGIVGSPRLVDPQGKPNHSEPARQGAGEMATRDHRELHSRSQGIPPPEVTVHDVKPGESLRAICRRYYGNAELADPLARYNGVPDPDVLQAEQRLRIPSAAVLLDPLARWDAGQEYTKAASSTDARHLTYTIKPGESLSEIAQRLLNSAGRWKQLYELNRDVLSDPNEIRAGTVITIPESGSGVGVRGSRRPAEP